MLVVAFDLSALVRYITRFTEESFACLIAIIFIYEAFKKQLHIIDHYGINPHPEIPIPHDCECFPPNITMDDNMTTVMASTFETTTQFVDIMANNSMDVMYNVFNASGNRTWADLTKEECLEYNGTLHGEGCEGSHYYPDVFFLSCLLFLGTYSMAMSLKEFKTSAYFPTFVSSHQF